MSANRGTLIARKDLVRVKIVQTQRELEKQRLMGPRASKQVAQTEKKLEQLQAEEATLRQEIDKAKEEVAASA